MRVAAGRVASSSSWHPRSFQRQKHAPPSHQRGLSRIFALLTHAKHSLKHLHHLLETKPCWACTCRCLRQTCLAASSVLLLLEVLFQYCICFLSILCIPTSPFIFLQQFLLQFLMLLSFVHHTSFCSFCVSTCCLRPFLRALIWLSLSQLFDRMLMVFRFFDHCHCVMHVLYTHSICFWMLKLQHSHPLVISQKLDMLRT